MAMLALAWFLIAGGVALVAWGLRRETAALACPVTDPEKGYALVRCLRTTVVGLALVGVGAGWLWQLPILVGLSSVIGGEELLETSVVIAATRQRQGRGAS